MLPTLCDALLRVLDSHGDHAACSLTCPAVVRVRAGERGRKQGMRERVCARVDVNDSERVKKTETEEGKKYVYSLM